MNPFQAIMGQHNPMTGGTGQTPMTGGPLGAMSNIMGRAQQLAGMFQNPQQMVAQYFPDAPAEIANDPNQLLQWMQQTGKVNPQMVQMARQMMGR